MFMNKILLYVLFLYTINIGATDCTAYDAVGNKLGTYSTPWGWVCQCNQPHNPFGSRCAGSYCCGAGPAAPWTCNQYDASDTRFLGQYKVPAGWVCKDGQQYNPFPRGGHAYNDSNTSDWHRTAWTCRAYDSNQNALGTYQVPAGWICKCGQQYNPFPSCAYSNNISSDPMDCERIH